MAEYLVSPEAIEAGLDIYEATQCSTGCCGDFDAGAIEVARRSVLVELREVSDEISSLEDFEVGAYGDGLLEAWQALKDRIEELERGGQPVQSDAE